MKTTHYRILILIVTILAMTLALFNTEVVFADDGQPPVEPVGTEEPVATEVPVETTEPVVIDIPVLPVDITSTEEPIATDVPTAIPEEIVAPEETGVQEIFEQIPPEMAVVALNEEGQLEPLVTQQAVEIILTSDPMWCPTGQIPGDTGCTAGYATAAELITALNGVSGDGTIYFTSTYSTNDLTFDQTNANLAGLGALTIQGGWNGSSGNAFALSGSTTFNGVGLNIINWTSDVTINDIIVGGSGGSGITVETAGNINLNNVSSNNNADHGAILDNENGIGNVILTGTNTFNDNDGIGLIVSSSGNILLNNITANGNEYGAGLENASGNGAVILTGTNTFNENLYSGLAVLSQGNISINDVVANNNGDTGVALDNEAGTGFIAVTGTNIFNNNGDFGLAILSSGTINLNNITANENNGVGVRVNGNSPTQNHTLTLSGINNFNNNGGDGLLINFKGNTSIENVTAVNNNGFGALLWNFGDVAFSGNNIFSNNLYSGLSLGADTISYSPVGNVVFAGNHQFNDNGHVGLYIVSYGYIYLENIMANNNTTGAILSNRFGNGNIVVSGTNVFNNNIFQGLSMESAGNIVLNDVIANGNGNNGLSALVDGDITVNCGVFQNNGNYGVYVKTSETLTLNGVILSGNNNGDVNLEGGGTVVTSPDCNSGSAKKPAETNFVLPEALVNVVGGESVKLDCEAYSGTKLILPNGDSFSVPCPLGDSASLTGNTSNTLPGGLPENHIFHSAFTTAVSENGQSLDKLAKYTTVSFAISADVEISNLAILYWDDSEWVEVDPFSTGDGYLEALVNYTGTFVLVMK